jgi:hypothetical protein
MGEELRKSSTSLSGHCELGGLRGVTLGVEGDCSSGH